MTNVIFYRCSVCGNIVMKILDGDQPLSCCGQAMQKLIPNRANASEDSHVPVVAYVGRNLSVSIGVIPHPMTQDHYIQWVFMESSRGGQLCYMEPNKAPETNFILENGVVPYCVYAYCSQHMLWKHEIDLNKDSQDL